MHFTDTVYRNPYWPTFPLLQITQGCTHNKCKFCTMYKGVQFRLQPMLVGTGGLTLFPGTPLLEEAERGEFTPLSEKEMLEELLLFVENLTSDCCFITHHTVTGKNLTGPDFLRRKDKIVAALRNEIEHGDMDMLAAIRRNKRSL